VLGPGDLQDVRTSAFFHLVTCYRPCLTPTFPSRQIPGDRLSLLSPTMNRAAALPDFRLPVHVAVWPRLQHRFLASCSSPCPQGDETIRLPALSRYLCPAGCPPRSGPCWYRCPHTDRVCVCVCEFSHPATLTFSPVQHPRGFSKPSVPVSPAIGQYTILLCLCYPVPCIQNFKL